MIGDAPSTAPFLIQYWSVLTDPAHLATELTIEVLTAIPGLIYARLWVKRHDKRKHNTTMDHDKPESPYLDDPDPDDITPARFIRLGSRNIIMPEVPNTPGHHMTLTRAEYYQQVERPRPAGRFLVNAAGEIVELKAVE